MSTSNALVQALPLLVSRYSKLFGTTVRMQGTSAYTNGSVITIPRLSLEDPTVARLACAYIAHESAHIRFTDFKAKKKYFTGKPDFLKETVFNVLEDCRVEHLIAKNYIGVYENLELLDNYYSKEWNSFIKKLDQAPVLKVICSLLLCYGHKLMNGYKNADVRARQLITYLTKQFNENDIKEILVKESELKDLKNTKEVTVLADKLVDMICKLNITKQHLARNKSKEIIVSENLKEENTKEQIEEMKPLELAQDQLKVFAKGDSSNVTPSKSASSVIEEFNIGASSAREDLGKFATSDLCKEGRADFINEVKRYYGFSNSLKQKVKSYVETYSRSAEQGKKINARKAQKVILGEKSIFFKREELNDFNTTVQILVDASSSMLSSDGLEYTRMEEANRVALSLALALEGVSGIDNMVTYFPGETAEFEDALRYGERAHFFAPRFDQRPRGSTPLAQAIYHCLDNLKKSGNTNRHVLLILSDGCPDSVTNTQKALKTAKAQNVEVYAISIRSEMIRKIFDNCIVCDSAEDLMTKAHKFFKELFDTKKRPVINQAA